MPARRALRGMPVGTSSCCSFAYLVELLLAGGGDSTTRMSQVRLSNLCPNENIPYCGGSVEVRGSPEELPCRRFDSVGFTDLYPRATTSSPLPSTIAVMGSTHSH